MNTKHRPPHAEFKIKELIKIGNHDEAQACTDENVEFYRDKIGDQQALFLEAQCGKMGVKPSRDNLLATGSAMPLRQTKPALMRRQAE